MFAITDPNCSVKPTGDSSEHSTASKDMSVFQQKMPAVKPQFSDCVVYRTFWNFTKNFLLNATKISLRPVSQNI